MTSRQEKKTPTGDESVGAKDQQAEKAGMTAHEEDHAATRSGTKPSIDAEGLIRAGLTLILYTAGMPRMPRAAPAASRR